MTKSAKQDTTEVSAQPAATESAATSGGADQQTSAQPLSTAEGKAEAKAAEAGSEVGGHADVTGGEAAQPDLDETKRKFREALERKHQVHNEGQGKGGRDGGKINNAHGPAGSRRNFRRKSG